MNAAGRPHPDTPAPVEGAAGGVPDDPLGGGADYGRFFDNPVARQSLALLHSDDAGLRAPGDLASFAITGTAHRRPGDGNADAVPRAFADAPPLAHADDLFERIAVRKRLCLARGDAAPDADAHTLADVRDAAARADVPVGGTVIRRTLLLEATDQEPDLGQLVVRVPATGEFVQVNTADPCSGGRLVEAIARFCRERGSDEEDEA